MTKQFLSLTVAATAAAFFTACGPSESGSKSSGAASSAPPPSDAVKSVAAQATQAATDLTGQLLGLSQVKSDDVLGAISKDLGPKLQSFAGAVGADKAVESQVQSTIQSLLAGRSAETVDLVSKLTQAKLTPEQMAMAKDVKNLAAAYVIQKDLSSVEGAQGEISTMVNSFRKGEVAMALSVAPDVLKKAKLTGPQKDLLTSIADKYAPGLKKAGDAVQGGLKGVKLPGN
jgi:hypothetical protein